MMRRLRQVGLTPSLPWAEGLNFVGPRVSTSFWGWALLAIGLVAVCHAADLMQRDQDEQADAQAVVDRLQRGGLPQASADRVLTEAAATQASAVGAAGPRADAPALSDDALRQVAQLALWLGHPWGETLDRVDATALQQGAVLMQFSLDLATLGSQPGVRPEVRMQAVVPDDAAAWRWLQALGPDAVMRSREPLAEGFSTARGQYALRIDVVNTEARP